MLLTGATAVNVIRALLEHISPRFGIVENLDSDNGSHFTTNVFKGFMKALEVKREYPHPPSSRSKNESDS
jgi:hypothetical protein